MFTAIVHLISYGVWAPWSNQYIPEEGTDLIILYTNYQFSYYLKDFLT